MKRDMDLIRDILRFIESQGKPEVKEISVDGKNPSEIQYHLQLLVEAGLITAYRFEGTYGVDPHYFDIRLTWDGHEFLEAARDDSRWKRAKKTVQESTGSITFALLKDYLLRLMRESVGLPF